MKILTPTEACLESSSDLTIATTEDIDIEHVHVFARRPIRSEVLVRCVRSTSARLENTMLTIRDGRCATVPPVLSLGCSVVSGIRHLDGTGRPPVRRGDGRRGLRRGPSGASDPSCRRVLHPNIQVSDGVFSTESCRYGGLRTAGRGGGPGVYGSDRK